MAISSDRQRNVLLSFRKFPFHHRKIGLMYITASYELIKQRLGFFIKREEHDARSVLIKTMQCLHILRLLHTTIVLKIDADVIGKRFGGAHASAFARVRGTVAMDDDTCRLINRKNIAILIDDIH